ncbi:DUF1850 domain-containing protein [Brevibacterium otitidis]|uniref:DUF1850 domain-containing protein n=1 Tax=Brevibacterium otitidis TaxID=53364 RepID=A0ABV5WZY9_9MICO|nr:hypothetical protein GCM10023233_28210 [Brevibacterium otitidis]
MPALAAVALTASAAAQATVLFRHQRRPREVYRKVEVSRAARISLSWIHSVDHTPWIEYYTLSRSGFLLDCTDLALTGAGAPSEAPHVEKVGSMLRYCGLDRRFDAVRWIHSHDVDHTISINGHQLLAAADLPHRTPVEMVLA